MRVSQMFSQFYTNSKKETYHQGVPPPPALSGEGSFFMTCWDVRYFGWFGEQNTRVFRGVECPRDIWSLVRFHVSIWVSILKTFCNYWIGSILYSGVPLFSRISFSVGLVFCGTLYSLFFPQWKSLFLVLKKNRNKNKTKQKEKRNIHGNNFDQTVH